MNEQIICHKPTRSKPKGKSEYVSDNSTTDLQNTANPSLIYGRNPVLEALSADAGIDKIMLQDGITSANKITALAREKGVQFQFVHKKKLDEVTENAAHQGIVAFVAARKYVEVDEILAIARERGEPPFVVIAENLTDPHNLGSVIRSANAAGAHGVIIPKNRSATLNATVAKTSAGAVMHTAVAKVANIAQTIERLKKDGVWIVGTDLSASQTPYDVDMKGAIAVVIGSEDKGISRLVRESCDFLTKIPMMGEVGSLNAGAACAVLLFEAVRQRTSD